MHRPENVDHRPVLKLLLDQLALVRAPVVLPLHPQTAARVEAFGLARSPVRSESPSRSTTLSSSRSPTMPHS